MEEKVITIQGRKKDVETILKLLNHIEMLGKLGATRNLMVRVDGDGVGRMHFIDLETVMPIPNHLERDKYTEYEKEHFTVGIYDIG